MFGVEGCFCIDGIHYTSNYLDVMILVFCCKNPLKIINHKELTKITSPLFMELHTSCMSMQ